MYLATQVLCKLGLGKAEGCDLMQCRQGQIAPRKKCPHRAPGQFPGPLSCLLPSYLASFRGEWPKLSVMNGFCNC